MSMENQLQDPRAEENKSQASRRQYKRFMPKQVSETNSSKKKKFEFNNYAPKNIVEIKPTTARPRQSHNEKSTPNLALARTNSQTILRIKTQDLRADLPPKQVKFTVEQPAEPGTGSSQVIQRVFPRCSESEISAYQLNKDREHHITHPYEFNLQSQRDVLLKQQLQTAIHKHKFMRDVYYQKIGEIKEVYQQMTYFIKEQLVKYEIEVSSFIKTFKNQFERQLRSVQTNIETRLLVSFKTDTLTHDTAQSQAQPLENKSINIPIKLDHTHIVGKLDKIKSKLDEIAQLDDKFAEEAGILDKVHPEMYNLNLKKTLLDYGMSNGDRHNGVKNRQTSKHLHGSGSKQKEQVYPRHYREQA